MSETASQIARAILCGKVETSLNLVVKTLILRLYQEVKACGLTKSDDLKERLKLIMLEQKQDMVWLYDKMLKFSEPLLSSKFITEEQLHKFIFINRR